MSFIQILVSVLNGLLDIILAIPRLLLWSLELFSATTKAEIARPALVSIEAELKNNGLLKGQSFLVTGKLNGISRAEVKSLIEENSGNILSSVSNKLDYLIIGEKPTKRKIDSAKELKIKIIDHTEFLKMLNKTS